MFTEAVFDRRWNREHRDRWYLLANPHGSGPFESAEDKPAAILWSPRRGEEGFHHVAYLVSDFAAERERLLGMGFELACELYADRVDAAYFDTRAVTGGFTEIHADPPHILEAFAAWRRLHARRQPGDDPIAGRGR